MKTFIQDCGRSASGIKEKADCTVRATAHCFGITYDEAHAKLSELGRKTRRRFKFSQVIDELGLEQRPDLCCKRLSSIVPELANGRFIVRITRHVFAVIDGTAYDTWRPKDGSHILMVYELPDRQYDSPACLI